MDAETYQEKMAPAHRMYLCRMLGVKELPACLLEQYARVKMMVDRIDAHLSPGDLAMIIMSAGVDSKVEQLVDPVSGKVEQPLDESGDQVVEETLLPDETAGPTEPAAQPAASGNLWSPGMPVKVLAEDELKQGKIVGVHPPELDSGKPIQITVEFEDGEIATVDEDEVEAD